ncbi:hypothetical protein N8T08_002418 [Aspergillus melleus]|uniref:Uncharacterized protein n=1 Tax=Aspergillus melleus TaxID=138277 RepID=A0ACC3ALZ6_9EURO|nr:hypothetical protein N8T08_002418 [Aspergillus melleus]
MTPATDIKNDVGQTSSDSTTEAENFKPSMPSNEAEDPFGNEEHGQIKYRVMSWWQCGIIMIAQNISLGILSLPSAVATLGIAPAIIILIGLSAISWYTAFVIGQFKLRHPQIHSMADAGELLMGRIGRELLGTGQLLLLVFIMASHILTFSVLMNTLTNHGTCTIVFAVVGTLVSFFGALPRTMDRVYWISVASFASILAATVVTMVAIGVQATGPDPTEATTEVSFQKAFLAVTNIVFAYIAHVAFFGYMSEMDEPRDFPKSLALLQIVDTCMYVVTAVVIYRYAGPDVASPALSSAGSIMKKVTYGLSIPTVIFSGVVLGHVAGKYVYVRLFRGSNVMHQRSFASIGAWVAIGAILWVVAFVIAESIPVFNDLLSLISALFGSWFSYGLPAVFWLTMNKKQLFSTPKKILLTVLNVLIFGIACAICVLGLWASGQSISDSGKSATWTCANNAD